MVNRIFTFLKYALLLMVPASGFAQVNISGGTTITQNFDAALGTSAINPWTDNSTVPGWYLTTSTLPINTGSTNSNSCYNFGNTGTNAITDRALGALSTSTTHRFGLRLKNNGAASIASFDISFTGEQWRSFNAGTLVFEYQVGTTVTSLTAGTWTAFTSLDFAALVTSSGASTDGNASANRTAKSATLTVTVPAGNEIFFRWTKAGTSSPGLAIDDLSITANGATSPSLSATALTSFSNVCINPAVPPVNSFTISGTNLTAADITVGALAGFTYSTDSINYNTSLTLSQSGGTYSQKVFVKFNPTLAQSYSGNIAVSGGGVASSINEATVGTGVNTAPALTGPASSSITTTTAVAAGNITDGGCSAVTERGVYWSTTSGFTPPGAGTKVSETGTFSTGLFTENLSGLPSGTTIYIKAYAVNSGGTTYTAQGSFATLKTEPSNQPSNFTKGTVTTSNIPLTWTAAAAGAQAPDGYLVKLNTAAVTAPADGTDPANQTAITAGAANNKSTGTSYSSFTGFTAGTMYNFSIYSYTNSGTAIDFNITNPPSFHQATLPAAVTAATVAVTGTGTANITWTAPGSYNTANHSTLVFLKPVSAVTAGVPTFQPSAYTANTALGGGTAYQNDAAAYCVYNGDGNSVSVSGLAPNTAYYALVYTVVDASNTDGSSSYSAAATANGTTLNTVVSLPYTQDFESAASEWTLSTTGTNKWAIGAATNNGGTKALYISQDGGTTNTYKVSTTQSGTDAALNVDLSSVTAATLFFDWKSNGEVVTGTYYDYGEVYINNNAGSGDVRISAANEFQGATAFANKIINLSAYAGNVVTIKFRWVNDGSGGNQPPMAVDNISIVAGAVPTLTTAAVSGITYNGASAGGNVTSDGGAAVTARGIVWSTAAHPVLGGSSYSSGTGTGSFTGILSNLAANTTYYVRAYATNTTGTAYGNELSFTTAQLNAPVATAVSNIDANSFDANWAAVPAATGYQLDVATDSLFVRNQLSEDFAGFTGVGGVDRGGSLNTYLHTPGWTGSKVFESSATAGIAQLGSGSAQGLITTPTIDLSSNSGIATLTFDLQLYNSDPNKLVQVLHAANGTTFTQVGSDITAPDSIATFTVNITGGTANSKIRIQSKTTTGNNRFLLDNINVTQSSTLASYSGLSVSGISQAVSSLTAGNTYYFRVRAANASSTSANSNIISGVPYAFSRFNSLADGNYSSTFTWQGWNGSQWINYPRPPHTTLDELYINHNVALTAPATVKTLSLNNNILSLGNNDLTVTDPIAGGSAASYVRTNGTGSLKQTVAAAPVAFPVGNTVYNPATLTNAGTSDVFGVRVADAVYNDGTGANTTTVATAVANHTWYVSEGTAGGSDVTMTLQWKNGEEINGFDLNHVYVQHYNGSAWEDYLAAAGLVPGTSPAATSLGGGYYTATQSGINSFSPFTVGSASSVPLAIHLLNINATAKNDKNLVTWEIASADEGDYFELERSSNGVLFEKTATIKTADGQKQYSYEDRKPFSGANHYRLNMVSRDGHSAYSKIVTVNNANGIFTCTAYPNPVTDKLVVSASSASGIGTVILEDVAGKILKQINITGGRCELDMSALAPGVYLVHYKDEVHTELFKIIK